MSLNQAPCAGYYTNGLYRQYTNAAAFHNFSALLGGSSLASSPGYHLLCVSASGADAGHVMQDGVVMLRYQKTGTKDKRTCTAPASASSSSSQSTTTNSLPRVSIVQSLMFGEMADAVGNKVTYSAVSIAFQAPSGIQKDGVITITTPYMYFASRAAAAPPSGTSISCATTACSGAVIGNVAVTNTAATSTVAGFGTITIVVAGAATTPSAHTLMLGPGTLTTGMPQAAGTITVSTSQDMASPPAQLNALGGQVTIGTPLTLSAADRVGMQATTSTVSIVFTPINSIPVGGIITINTPFNYFASRYASSLGSSLVCSTTACASVTLGDVEVTNTAAVGSISAFGSVKVAVKDAATTSSAITLTFGIGVLITGTPQPSTTAGITVSTTQDYASTGAPSPSLGGQVSGVSFSLTTADRVGNK
jgi:hypothetical protein